MIFSSSSISSVRFCSRPAVSISRTSTPSALAAVTASKAMPAASEPCSRAITFAPTRPPQIFNCSIAAARKVSPAASITLRPSRCEFRRELADGRGLAGAVHAGNQNDERLCALDLKWLRDRDQHFLDLGRRSSTLRPSASISLRVAALSDHVADPRRGRETQIGADHRLLDLVQQGIIEPALADETGDARVPSEAELRFRPELSFFHQLRRALSGVASWALFGCCHSWAAS